MSGTESILDNAASRASRRERRIAAAVSASSCSRKASSLSASSIRCSASSRGALCDRDAAKSLSYDGKEAEVKRSAVADTDGAAGKDAAEM